MPEPVTTELIAGLLADAAEVFPRKSIDDERQATVWRNALGALDGDAVRTAMRVHIREGKGFPRVAEIRELAKRIEVSRAKRSGGALPGDRCASCGRPWEWFNRYRPVTDKRGRLVRTLENDAVLLEVVERYGCPEHHAAAFWINDAKREDGAPAMLLAALDGVKRAAG